MSAVPAALRASEHPRRPGRRAGGAVSRGHGLLSVPGGGGQARLAAAAGAVRVRGRGRLLAVARVPRLSGRAATPSRRWRCWTSAAQSAAAWRSYLNGHEAHLRELRSFTPEVYLAVSLAGARRLVRGVDRIRRRVEGAVRRRGVRCRSRRRRSRRWSSPRSARSGAPRRRCRCGARRRASCSGCCAAPRAAASPSRRWMIIGSRAR